MAQQPVDGGLQERNPHTEEAIVWVKANVSALNKAF